MEAALKLIGLYLLIYSSGVALSFMVDGGDQIPAFILELVLFFGWGSFLIFALAFFMYKNDA